MATKPKSAVTTAKARVAKPPKGQYYGPEANKGRLPKGYKGPEKGKYYGPDSKKGRTASYKAPTPTVAPTAPNPSAPTNPDPTNPGYQRPGGTTANNKGNVVLPGDYESVSAAIAAQEDAIAAENEYNAANDQVNIDRQKAFDSVNKGYQTSQAQVASRLASRGLTSGTVRVNKAAAVDEAKNTADNEVLGEYGKGTNEGETGFVYGRRRNSYATARKTAREAYNTRESAAALARQRIASGGPPVEGSEAEDAGITAPSTDTPKPPAAAPKPPAAPKPAAKTYKGKYRGPDRFKGDAKKLAAWRKAGKPKK